MRQIVDRIGSILSHYTFDHPEWGVTELAARSAMPKSTVSEILASLAGQGLVERTGRGRYRLGWRIFELNHVLLESNPLVRESRRVMQELVERHGESSHLMVLERRQAVIVEKLQATLATQILMSRVGLRLPAHCSSCGKVLLAFLPWPEVARMFDQVELERFTPNTITDLKVLRRELAVIREEGLAFDHEESIPGLSCVAAPIRDESGNVVAALSVAMPTYRFVEDQEKFAQLLKVQALRISRRLGHEPPVATIARTTRPTRPRVSARQESAR